MTWIITYNQNTGHQIKTANAITDRDPADWLINAINESPDAETVLINAVQVDDKYYELLKNCV